MAAAAALDRRAAPNGYAILDGRVLHDDQWDGYPAERARLARELQARGDRGGRTLILSGDVHSSWAFEGPCDADTGEAVAVEVTTPAVSSAAMGRAHLPGMWRLLDRAANDLEHVRWAEVTERGYCTIDLTPDAATATWWFVHPYDDEPSDARRASHGVPDRPSRLAAEAQERGACHPRPRTTGSARAPAAPA